MIEPADLLIRKPVGGWPTALVRIQLDPDCRLEDALRAAAVASRKFRCGVATTFHHVPLIAYPDELVIDIALAYRRQAKRMQDDAVLTAAGRWTAKKKAWLIEGIQDGHISQAQALVAYDISIEELQTWEALFLTGGVEALRLKRIPEHRK